MWLLSRQAVIAPIVFCVCILGVGLIQFPKLQKLLASNQATSLEVLEKDVKLEKIRLNLLQKMPSFGYDNWIADWVYLNFLQYYGDDELRAKTGYSLSPEYFEVILERDPRFLAAYQSLSTSTSLYAAMPERAIKLMDKGLKSLSPQLPEKYYYIWRYKGIDELLFLGNSQAAKESFIMAATWANHFSDEESKNVAIYSLKTAEFLSHNPNSIYAQIATWAMVLNNQIDERTRKIAINQIEALGGKVIPTPEGTHKIIFPPKD
ncbi:hypothetical protein JYQ62_31280 [Nostoc sp. UHCC 0702]|nr:hypothetical protein JYQ62_31280 [Nostoc sp. UHCC 0702]